MSERTIFISSHGFLKYQRMELIRLNTLPLENLVAAFNAAFEGYFVKIKMTEDLLLRKIKNDNIRLDYSVGVLDNGQLQAFIWIATDNYQGKTEAYNAATGVLPDYRGRKLTGLMYTHLFPFLKSKNISKHRLEVITENIPAIKSYERVGFEKTKTLSVFKGIIPKTGESGSTTISPATLDALGSVETFWNSPPSWQNSLPAIQRTLSEHSIIAALDKAGEPVGYVAYSLNPERIKQFAVRKDYRNQGIGSSLFEALRQVFGENPVMITNIDDTDAETVDFLEKRGFELLLQQFEMQYHYLQS